MAGFYDPNPCLVFEHKLLYWSKSGAIDFNGRLADVWRARKYSDGSDLTLVAFGAMVYEALSAAGKTSRNIEVWNPFVLQPLAIEPIIESVRKTGRLLVVQECGMTQGLGEMLMRGWCVRRTRPEMPAATVVGPGRARAVRTGTGRTLPAQRGEDCRGGGGDVLNAECRMMRDEG